MAREDHSLSILELGTNVGPYLIESLVATAGYSCVYRASCAQHAGSVAMKVLHPELAASSRMLERFRREFTALRNISHDNIVEIYDYGELDDGRPFFVMEWLEGVSLHELVRRGPLSLEELEPLMAQLVAALSAVHAAELAHRDVKSSNVVVVPNRDGTRTVKLIDFGIAKSIDREQAKRSGLTSSGSAIGTPHSMAPEQIYGDHADARTDIYAFGVLLYRLLTGKHPFHSVSPAEIVDMHLHVPPPNASDIAPVPPAVDAVIHRCMAKQRSDRFVTIDDAWRAFTEAAFGSVRRMQGFDAVGLYCELEMGDESGEWDEDDAFDELEQLLGNARDMCETVGMRLAIDAGSSFMAVTLLEAEPLESRVRAIVTALDIADSVRAGDCATDFTMRITLHAAFVQAEFTRGHASFIDGELLNLSEWATAQTRDGVVVTKAMLAGLEDRFVAHPLGDDGSYWRVESAVA